MKRCRPPISRRFLRRRLGPLYVTPNYPIETNATAPAAQKLELIRYMQGGGAHSAAAIGDDGSPFESIRCLRSITIHHDKARFNAGPCCVAGASPPLLSNTILAGTAPRARTQRATAAWGQGGHAPLPPEAAP